MYFVNHEKQILVFWFHKCGHTSLIDFFDSVGNFTLYEAWNQLDSYTYIERNEPKLLRYKKCMITRNPIDYCISGYKHFVDRQNQIHRVKSFFEQILLDRFNDTEYTFEKHLEILLSNDVLFHKKRKYARDFFTHCCRKQSYTYRPDVRIIHLEKIHQLSNYLNKHGVQTTITFPHSNKREDNIEVEISKTSKRYLDLLYRIECEKLGYNFESTINSLCK